MRIAETGLVFHHGLMVRSMIAIRALQLLTAIFASIYSLLAARWVMTYVGADEQLGLARLIWQATADLYAPFQRVLRAGDDGAGHPLEWSLLVAIATYADLHVLSRKLVLALGRPRK